jgi:hypothetical protein
VWGSYDGSAVGSRSRKEHIEVGGGNYCQIWVASRVEGSKEKFAKRFESGNLDTVELIFFVKTRKTNLLSGVGVGALLKMVLVLMMNGPYLSEKHN